MEATNEKVHMNKPNPPEVNERARAKTRHKKRLGAAPDQGNGTIKCRICGKPLANHDLIKSCVR